MRNLVEVSIPELKRMCIEQKIVSKNLKMNPRKDKKSEPLCSYLSDHFESPLRVAIDVLFRHDGKVPLCKYCNKTLNLFDLPNYKPIKYSHKSCSKLARKSKINWNDVVQKRKSSCLKRYGTENIFDYDTMVTKARETKLERYGNKNYVNSEKARKTKLERYGDSNYRNDDKIKETCLSKYGAENPFGSSSIIEKNTEILNERYGGRGFGSPDIKKRIEDTNQDKYGVNNAMQNKEISSKSCNSKRRKYFGDEVYIQLTENLTELYEKYEKDNSLSITKLAKSLNLDRNTLGRSFSREGFAILDRNYSCSSSAGEDYLFNILKKIDPNLDIIRNTRKVIAPKEIDLWIPSHNLGIEYHGSYWHQEGKVKNLHHEKAVLSKQMGIRLIQIFDYELIEFTDKIQNLLKSALGVFDAKIAARECKVKLLNTKEARIFCEKNHLQGYGSAKLNYGLVHKEMGIIQLLSFAKPRFSNNYQWEIIRSCSKAGVIILGGLERLWSKFIKDNNPESVITYSDARFFNGNSYSKLGFHYQRHSGSNYIWTNGIERLSRYKTQKKKLIENGNFINNSEYEIMKSNGFHKILDAGNYVFVWENQIKNEFE